MIINYDIVKFICKPCGKGVHTHCAGDLHCDCQHREKPKPND